MSDKGPWIADISAKKILANRKNVLSRNSPNWIFIITAANEWENILNELEKAQETIENIKKQL